ncbi:hypothetical protein GF319_10155 [Candidatus Bathyarchaeota archaeon]|nr:hypothetical protein [Candidatus Bathyarchaeota archaeon]
MDYKLLLVMLLLSTTCIALQYESSVKQYSVVFDSSTGVFVQDEGFNEYALLLLALKDNGLDVSDTIILEGDVEKIDKAVLNKALLYVIVNPVRDFSEGDKEILSEYVSAGGSLILLSDSPSSIKHANSLSASTMFKFEFESTESKTLTLNYKDDQVRMHNPSHIKCPHPVEELVSGGHTIYCKQKYGSGSLYLIGDKDFMSDNLILKDDNLRFTLQIFSDAVGKDKTPLLADISPPPPADKTISPGSMLITYPSAKMNEVYGYWKGIAVLAVDTIGPTVLYKGDSNIISHSPNYQIIEENQEYIVFNGSGTLKTKFFMPKPIGQGAYYINQEPPSIDGIKETQVSIQKAHKILYNSDPTHKDTSTSSFKTNSSIKNLKIVFATREGHSVLSSTLMSILVLLICSIIIYLRKEKVKRRLSVLLKTKLSFNEKFFQIKLHMPSDYFNKKNGREIKLEILQSPVLLVSIVILIYILYLSFIPVTSASGVLGILFLLYSLLLSVVFILAGLSTLDSKNTVVEISLLSGLLVFFKTIVIWPAGLILTLVGIILVYLIASQMLEI